MMGPGFGGGNFLFSIFPYIFGFIFIIVVGTILFTLFKGIKQWSYNNKQPVLSVNAEVISKRSEMRRRSNAGDDNMGSSTRTIYFTTFEVESGDRMELQMEGREQGLLAEGDIGTLTFQGTRYKSFERMAS